MILLQSLVQNPLVIAIGLVATMASVVLAIYFYLKSKRDKRPTIGIVSHTIVEGMEGVLDGLAITYAGARQARVSVASVFFWNAGKEPLRKDDIARSDPPRFEVGDDAKVLSVKLLGSTDLACEVTISSPSLEARRWRVPFAFEHLDHLDGFAIQIVHNGPAAQTIQYAGKLVGAEKVQTLWLDYSGRSSFNENAQFFLLSLAFVLMAALLVFVMPSALEFKWSPLVFLMFAGIFIFSLDKWRDRIPPTVPKKLLQALTS